MNPLLLTDLGAILSGSITRSLSASHAYVGKRRWTQLQDGNYALLLNAPLQSGERYTLFAIRGDASGESAVYSDAGCLSEIDRVAWIQLPSGDKFCMLEFGEAVHVYARSSDAHLSAEDATLYLFKSTPA